MCLNTTSNVINLTLTSSKLPCAKFPCTKLPCTKLPYVELPCANLAKLACCESLSFVEHIPYKFAYKLSVLTAGALSLGT
jgi:hypothetical protein